VAVGMPALPAAAGSPPELSLCVLGGVSLRALRFKVLFSLEKIVKRKGRKGLPPRARRESALVHNCYALCTVFAPLRLAQLPLE